MKDYSAITKVFKAFDDENRIHILNSLRDGEKCACDLLADMRISQPTLSHHMKILCDSGVVRARKAGKWIHYSINQNGLKDAIDLLWSFFGKFDT